MQLNHYLLIRHTPNGRKYPFLDCWGLVIEFYRRELGIELDECADFSIRDGYEKEKNSFREIPPDEAALGDVIAFFRHGVIFHVAVFLGKGEMLHTGLNRHARAEKVRALQFAETQFFRYGNPLNRGTTSWNNPDHLFHSEKLFQMAEKRVEQPGTRNYNFP